MGVSCVVVRDTVTVDGKVVEDTLDWYAQDSGGNVGTSARTTGNTGMAESPAPMVPGRPEWTGAQPGIVMRAHPQVGDRYRMEYAPGEAEDIGQVLSLNQRASVPFGDFDVVVIKDCSPLDPGFSEHKLYARVWGPSSRLEGGDEWVELVEMTVP